MDYYMDKQMMCITLNGELGSLEIQDIKEKLVRTIDEKKPRIVVLDMDEVHYIDSATIGFILARYNQLKHYGAKLTICNIHHATKKILELSGVHRIIQCIDAMPKEEVR